MYKLLHFAHKLSPSYDSIMEQLSTQEGHYKMYYLHAKQIVNTILSNILLTVPDCYLILESAMRKVMLDNKHLEMK